MRDFFANVKEYGATGDGISDDTAAFIGASQTGRRVFIPSGTYSVSNILLSQVTDIVGSGINQTIIKARGEQSVITLSDGYPFGSRLKDFSVDGNGTSSYGIFVRTGGGIQSEFSNISIRNCLGNPGYGFATEVSVYSMLLDRIKVTENNIGIYLPGGNQNTTIRDSFIYNNSGGQIHIVNPINIRVRGTEIENALSDGIDTINLRIQGTNATDYTKNISLEGCYFESNREGTVDIKIDTGFIFAKIDSMYANGNNRANYSIQLDSDCAITLTNSDIVNYALGAINESSGIHNIVTTNSYLAGILVVG